MTDHAPGNSHHKAFNNTTENCLRDIIDRVVVEDGDVLAAVEMFVTSKTHTTQQCGAHTPHPHIQG